MGSLAQAKQVTLTDTQGRELVCKLLNKNEDSVLVSNKSGKKFTIPLIKLSQDSISLVSSHEYFIPKLLEELKASDALVCEYRLTNRLDGSHHAYQYEYVGKPIHSNSSYEKRLANVDRLKVLIENYGVSTQKDINVTVLSLSIYGFIKAAADMSNADPIGRIIQGSFNRIGLDPPIEGFLRNEISWRLTRVNNLLNDYPNEAISEEITEFFNKVLIEKGAKRAKRVSTSDISYRVSDDIVDSAKRLLRNIDYIESKYAF